MHEGKTWALIKAERAARHLREVRKALESHLPCDMLAAQIRNELQVIANALYLGGRLTAEEERDAEQAIRNLKSLADALSPIFQPSED